MIGAKKESRNSRGKSTIVTIDPTQEEKKLLDN